MSKRKMLVYTKRILRRVSFDAKLFQKELKKALHLLSESEARLLKRWVLTHFYQLGAPVLIA
ncbi:MAG: hypothetical protein KDC83_06850 [Flavobacteriales bacterium]|nr:hypothetical protein [Flavobacteriales bacterium]